MNLLKSKANIILLVSDGFGAYQTEEMTRVRKFLSPCLAYDRVITAACDTHMVLSSVLSSRLPIEIHMKNMHHYPPVDIPGFPTLRSIMHRYGYETYGVTCARYSRNRSPEINPVNHRFVPERYQSPNLIDWQEYGKILDSFLSEKSFTQPAVFVFHYYGERIWERRPAVEKIIERVHKAGINVEDALMVMFGDHGWTPHANYGNVGDLQCFEPVASQSFRLRDEHTRCLDNYNIVVPLFIKYPGCGHTIDSGNYWQLDILPTILDLMGLGSEIQDHDFVGRSILAAGNRTHFAERTLRVDTRYLFDRNRRTALIGKGFKYIREPENYNVSPNEELYRIDDWHERYNLIYQKDHQPAVDTFRSEMDRTDAKVRRFHSNRLKTSASPLLKALKPDAGILIMMTCQFNQFVSSAETLNALFPGANIHLLVSKTYKERVIDQCPWAERLYFYGDGELFTYRTFDDLMRRPLQKILSLAYMPSRQRLWLEAVEPGNRNSKRVTETDLWRLLMDVESGDLKSYALLRSLMDGSYGAGMEQLPIELRGLEDTSLLYDYVILPIDGCFKGIPYNDPPVDLLFYQTLVEAARRISSQYVCLIDHFIQVAAIFGAGISPAAARS